MCEKCPDGRVWNPVLNVCDCDDCPEGFNMVDGKCVDDEGDVSEEAPIGFYADPVTGMCLPIPDCSNERPGTTFDMATGQCECKDGPNPLDEEAPLIPYSWSDIHNQCMPNYNEVCGENEYWDEVAGRCRTLTESMRKILDGGGSARKPTEDEEVEGLIVEEGKAKVKQSGLINPETGDYITKNEMRQQGFDDESLRTRGYTESWETVSVAKKGLNPILIPNTLHGLLTWVENQDTSVSSNKVKALPLWNRINQYRLVFQPVEGEEDAYNKFVEVWSDEIGSKFPVQFTLNKTSNGLIIEDKRSS